MRVLIAAALLAVAATASAQDDPALLPEAVLIQGLPINDFLIRFARPASSAASSASARATAAARQSRLE